MRYTEGKLTVSTYGTEILDSRPVRIASVDGRSFDEQQANARRLVACWNACVGIPTEAIDGDLTVNAPSMLLLARTNQRLLDERDDLMKVLRKASTLGAAYYGLVNAHELHQVFIDADAILARYQDEKS